MFNNKMKVIFKIRIKDILEKIKDIFKTFLDNYDIHCIGYILDRISWQCTWPIKRYLYHKDKRYH